MTEKLSDVDIQKLLSGETITISSGLNSKESHPVSIECYAVSFPEEKWILVTAVANQIAIGFIDARFFTEGRVVWIEAPYIKRANIHELDFPHQDIRHSAKSDGVFVDENERKNGIGRNLMNVVRAIALGLNGRYIKVSGVLPRSQGFYKKLNHMEDQGGSFVDPLNNK